MKTLTFSTNINCGGCVATVKPYLDAEPGVAHWSVDTNDREKILTVTGDVRTSAVVDTVTKAGFRIQPVG